MKIFLDTNIFLAILNEEENWELVEKLLLDVHNGKHTGYTSVICISEILSGFYAEDESEKGEMFLTDIKAINNLTITDVDLIIAKDAARIRAKYKIKLPDAMIAASCIVHKCKLITQDENLKKLKEIEVKSIDKI
ncbi:putative nucleic acid-binding protein, contains PIN domain [Candidatus Methanoperedens nitroreducens]|uniref:Putative nucleic acid-binding protein, contains PIN domain n=1 Tax=Candidatus Methanoperedens nitratireducens TaxID=1392998 RepID=A0A062UY93_9EURY|nr:PIN domain-containing protein [Candidatus Methanoperedens nitroreducens]KCZ71916.1 putative nucleic acid-binding protein, contains PIN domain [Candidatus Methanoperedens nitroreducens]MDJ1422109.1 PIN domain-containing protein [Candidatus Methanoperedens sp.]